MADESSRPADLREACVREALAIVETSGVEQLSLREVARRLGVSHQAPYKHFASRDHILAEIVARAFDSFAEELDRRPRHQQPFEDLGAMGMAYLQYAQAHPLQYRLMFGTPLPDPEQHPQMMQQARHVFSLLYECLRQLPTNSDREYDSKETSLDALFVWSTVHGLASILQTCALQTLDISADELEDAAPHVLTRIGYALGKGVLRDA
ncbi:MAG: TetR/AcrR family transcriptional regulator [Pseudomonadota bacterium]